MCTIYPILIKKSCRWVWHFGVHTINMSIFVSSVCLYLCACACACVCACACHVYVYTYLWGSWLGAECALSLSHRASLPPPHPPPILPTFYLFNFLSPAFSLHHAAHFHAHIYMHTLAYHSRTYTHTRTRTHTHTLTYAHIHTPVFICLWMWMYTSMCT